MKNRKTSTFIIALLAVVFSAFVPKVSVAQPFGRVSLDLFYDELSPYGYWEQDRQFGDIWFPARVPRDFRPYGTNGYWTMTEYGNTWVSGYDWGWATFHYGRWVYTDYNGWGWIPGYEWGPAWVDWRTGGGYYGWAPMAPVMNVRVAVAMPINLWVFLPTRRIYDHRMHRYWSYGQSNVYHRTTVINNTYIVNNNHYYGGPGRRDIEHHIGRPVEVRTIRTTDSRGASRVDNRSVSMYRPDDTRSSTRTGTATTVRSDRNTVGTREGSTSTRGNTVGTREGSTSTRGNTVGTREGSTSTRGNTVGTREGSTSTRGNTVGTREHTTSTRGTAVGNSSSSRTDANRASESRQPSTIPTNTTGGSATSNSRGNAVPRAQSSGSESSRSSSRGAVDSSSGRSSSRGSIQQAPAQVERGRAASSSRGEATASGSSGSSERRTR